MELSYKITDMSDFLNKIGYTTENAFVTWSTDGGRRDDDHYSEHIQIAYKGKRPDTNLGYSGDYNFKNTYSVTEIFKKEFPAYLIQTVIKTI